MHGGDLNLINLDYETPLAFGKEEILKRFNLQKGVAKISKHIQDI